MMLGANAVWLLMASDGQVNKWGKRKLLRGGLFVKPVMVLRVVDRRDF